MPFLPFLIGYLIVLKPFFPFIFFVSLIIAIISGFLLKKPVERLLYFGSMTACLFAISIYTLAPYAVFPATGSDIQDGYNHQRFWSEVFADHSKDPKPHKLLQVNDKGTYHTGDNAGASYNQTREVDAWFGEEIAQEDPSYYYRKLNGDYEKISDAVVQSQPNAPTGWGDLKDERDHPEKYPGPDVVKNLISGAGATQSSPQGE